MFTAPKILSVKQGMNKHLYRADIKYLRLVGL